MPDFTYDLDGTDPTAIPDDVDMLRFLINDVDQATMVFTNSELRAMLRLEGGAVKLAAAQIIDTNADNEALASKVLRTQDLSTDGSKIAAALHQRAQLLRQQHFDSLEDGAFIITRPDDFCGIELTD